jgi:NADH-quinone oxidoreductase subunit G
MNAHLHVSEEKPPIDPDSPLTYTMEGTRHQPPSSMIPFFWSPGWNSVQSVNKYQQEVGASLKDGDPGLRLIEPSTKPTLTYFEGVPEAFVPMENQLWIVPTYHIFGSEEMSSKSSAIQKRIQPPYILVNAVDANVYHVNEGDVLSFTIDQKQFKLPVKINSSLPVGVAAIPYGLDRVPNIDLPDWGIVEATTTPRKMPDTEIDSRILKVES